MKNSINERIHDLRERSGLTQTDLAIRLGVTRSCVNAWEMGVSRPSLDNVLSLGRIFHTTTDYLLGFDSAESFFSIMGPLSPLASGQFYIESVLDAIGQAISAETGERVKKISGKIAKHTSKYHR